LVGSNRKSFLRSIAPTSGSAALVAILAAIAFGSAGCALPLLGAIPSVISVAHAAYTAATGGTKDDADAKDPDADAPTEEASKPPPQLTPANLCQMMAISHPDMVLVELRKNGSGAPEYRELHLQNSTDEAHWTPTVDSETGPDGWIPAVNFLKMNFQPPLTNSIPDVGTCYLAYAPIAMDPNDPYQAAELKSETGSGLDTFSWGGRVYQYTVARTLPCLSPSS
jgi:hypothetical protein